MLQALSQVTTGQSGHGALHRGASLPTPHSKHICTQGLPQDMYPLAGVRVGDSDRDSFSSLLLVSICVYRLGH